MALQQGQRKHHPRASAMPDPTAGRLVRQVRQTQHVWVSLTAALLLLATTSECVGCAVAQHGGHDVLMLDLCLGKLAGAVEASSRQSEHNRQHHRPVACTMACTTLASVSMLGWYYLLRCQHAMLSRTLQTTSCRGHPQLAKWVPFATLLQQVQTSWVCEMQMLERFVPRKTLGTKDAPPASTALHC